MRLFNYVRDAVALCVVFSGLWLGNAAVGDVITVPTGLSVGDQYRLVFISSTFHNALSSDISTYNSIVDALGDTAIASDWKVIGSTATVDAIDNTATPIATSGVSIWRLDGVQVADNYADLWDGSLDADISTRETGGTVGGSFGGSFNFVWTGTETDGRKKGNDLELGSVGKVQQGDADPFAGTRGYMVDATILGSGPGIVIWHIWCLHRRGCRRPGTIVGYFAGGGCGCRMDPISSETPSGILSRVVHVPSPLFTHLVHRLT